MKQQNIQQTHMNKQNHQEQTQNKNKNRKKRPQRHTLAKKGAGGRGEALKYIYVFSGNAKFD